MGLTERVRDTVARLEVEVAPHGLDSLMKWAERALHGELDGHWYPIGHDVRRAADVVALAAEDFDELEAVVTCEEKRPGAAGRRRKRLSAAIDSLVDKLVRQLNKHKEKLSSH
jgi:hypothetical protein